MSGIGHLAAGFAAKPTNPQIPLWALLIAAESNDILYGVFMFTGLEPKVGMTMNFTDGVRYATPATDPFSHGLFMSIVWSLLAISDWLCNLQKVASRLGARSGSFQPLDFGFSDAFQSTPVFQRITVNRPRSGEYRYRFPVYDQL